MTPDWSTIQVRDYQSGSLVTVRPETPLTEVQRLLERQDITAVPVVEGSVLTGILSTTDLLRVARLELRRPGDVVRITALPHLAREVMRAPVVAIAETDSLRDAASSMVEHRIHGVVVVRGETPVGMLTTRDAMRAVRSYRVEEPLARVLSAPVITVDVGDSIATAVDRLADANVHGLVVVDGDWPVGVFTHTEAIKARALPPDLLETPVEGVMSYETICLNVHTPLYRVAGHAIEMRVRRILATENRKLVGIVTGFDVVKLMTLGVAN